MGLILDFSLKAIWIKTKKCFFVWIKKIPLKTYLTGFYKYVKIILNLLYEQQGQLIYLNIHIHYRTKK